MYWNLALFDSTAPCIPRHYIIKYRTLCNWVTQSLQAISLFHHIQSILNIIISNHAVTPVSCFSSLKLSSRLNQPMDDWFGLSSTFYVNRFFFIFNFFPTFPLFWAAAPMGLMTYAFTQKRNFCFFSFFSNFHLSIISLKFQTLGSNPSFEA